MITAPFNFVPLNEKVFFPPWAEDVSHDVPFEDGESGLIDITITAKSPIFIRNNYVDGDDYIEQNGKKVSTNFCHHNGQHYIPGNSVKGMVRNVLEIMSFGKLKLDTKKHTKITSVRDMTNSRELVGTAKGCGLLKKDANGKWIIVDYGKPRTIKYTNQANKIIHNGNNEINCDFETAQEKYEANELYQVVYVRKDAKDLTNRDGKVIGTKSIATISNSGEEAYLVLTGGIDNKKNEFVFAKSDKKDNPITNIEKVVSKFKDVYFNSKSIDGNFWRDNWDENIGIPVFYIKNGNQITDIGLSQLFKLAYNQTIDEATKQIMETVTKKRTKEDNERKYHKLDLAETIFGAIQEEIVDVVNSKKVNCALKGRVQLSHFKCDTNPQEYQTITTVLGSPNSSFYPEYIQQNCKDNGKVQNDKYNTLMDSTSKISGWKRYPLRYGKPEFTNVDEGTDSATTFTPIGTYSANNFNEFTFSGKLRFHNLKKAELGALLSALTFHSNQDKFYHNIGMAKSLGFGKIKMNIDIANYTDAIQEYEILMQEWTQKNFKVDWIDTEQIKELFTMAFKDLDIDSKLKYLKLDPENNVNEFVDKKKHKECLPKVSKMFDIDDNIPRSLLSNEFLQERKEAKEKKEAQNKEKEAYETALKTENIDIVTNFIKNYPQHEDVEKIRERKNSLEKSAKNERYEEVNKKAQNAYDTLLKKKANPKQYEKEKVNFIKKWEAKKNNKGSEFILDLVDKLKS